MSGSVLSGSILGGRPVDGIRRSRQALAAGSRSFALAGKLLPPACRDDAAVVYAFCRRADDLVDDTHPQLAPLAVERLRRELDAIYAGAPQPNAVLASFQEVAARRGIPREVVDELYAGFAMDARPTPIAYHSWDELLLYCYRVAGTVGLMMCRVMGVSHPPALRNAAALGMAMQLTNIARDVNEDWRRGRLYIPREALTRGARIPALRPGTPLGPEQAACLSAAVPALLRASEPLYRWGDEGLRALDLRAAVAVRAARLIYSEIGARLEARGHDVLAPRTVVPRGRKLWLALRALVGVPFARVGRPARLGPVTSGTGWSAALPGALPRTFPVGATTSSHRAELAPGAEARHATRH